MAKLASGIAAKFIFATTLATSFIAGASVAGEFRSISTASVLYDSPSTEGKPLYVIRRYTPVERFVSLNVWSKVRDADGAIAWIEKKYLSDVRTVQVTAPLAQVRREALDSSPLVFEAQKGIAMEVLEPGSAGWAKVRHRDGVFGYVRTNQVWGL